MKEISAITCSRCKVTIDVPENGTTWCKCGKTYARRDVAGVGWGGPGNPGAHERDPHEEAKRAEQEAEAHER